MGGNINALQQFWDRNKKVIDKILFYLKNHKWLCVTIIAVILIFVIGIIVFHIEKQITIAHVSINYNDYATFPKNFFMRRQRRL